jgi:hypothetical protein
VARQSAKYLDEALKAWQRAPSWIAEVEEVLKGVITERDASKSWREKDAVELKKLTAERREVVTLANATKEETPSGNRYFYW